MLIFIDKYRESDYIELKSQIEFQWEEIQLVKNLTSQIKKAIDTDSTAQNPTCHKTVTKSDSVTVINR